MLNIPLSTSLLGIITTILGVFCNASAGIFARTIIQDGEIGIVVASMYRFFLSLPFIILFLLVTKHKFVSIDKKDLCLMILGGLLFGIGVITYNTSFLHTTMANANLFSNLIPFAVVPLSAFFFGEKINLQFILAVLISTFGIVLLVYNFSPVESAPDKSYALGNMLAIISMLIYAVYIVIISGLRKKLSASELMFYMSLFAGLIILVFAFFNGDSIVPSKTSTIMSLFGLALITHLLGAVVIAFGAGYISASMASILIMSQPIAGIFYGLIFYNETLTMQEFVGMIITIVGVIYAQKSSSKL